MDNLVQFYAIRIYNEAQYNEITQLLYSYDFHWRAGNYPNYSVLTGLNWLFLKIPDKIITCSSDDFRFTKTDFQIFPEECEPLLKLKSTL